MPLEELDLALMLLRGLFRAKGAEVAALAGPRIFLARIESVFAGSKFADHRFNSAPLPVKSRPMLWFRGAFVPLPGPS